MSGQEVLVLDDKLRQMLRDLSRALYEAISDSSEVGESLRRIRREGYTLHLLLDCKRDDEGNERSGRGEGGVERLAPEPLGVPVGDFDSDPVFRINGQDLVFLR